MNTNTAPMLELHQQLENRVQEFANALPSHIKPEHFQRATLTAISQNPKLLNVDRRSLFNALMRCAQDGLIPDGRQAALVIYKDRERGAIAQYQQMVAGVRLLVQQSGEVSRFEQTVVHAGDEFEYCLGDHPHIEHKPALGDRGEPIAAYSIAQYKDGTLSREVMTVAEIEKVRGVSRAKDSGPWVDWWDEMARKTVAKRHAKILPMSNDAATALARDDATHFELPAAVAPVLPPSSSRQRPRLADQLDALSAPPPTGAGEDAPIEKRRRGRPKMTADDQVRLGREAAQIQRRAADAYTAQLKADLDRDPIEAETIDETEPEPDQNDVPDYYRGKADAELGRMACLDSNIRNDTARLADWQRGYDSVKNNK